MPNVTVLYFAALRERKGRAMERVEVPAGTTLHQLFTRLFTEPERDLPVAFARNQVSAEGAQIVAEGDEIAFLPPLGGG